MAGGTAHTYGPGDWQRAADDWRGAGLPQELLPRSLDIRLLRIFGRPVISPFLLEDGLRTRLPDEDWEHSSLRDIVARNYGTRAAVVVEDLL